MKVNDIFIRDPYILVHNNKYYLYGTRSNCWSEMDGFDVYVSEDLENWEGPFEIFHKPEGFWATQNYWAPECFEKNGDFYFITTLGAKDRKKSINVFKSDSPLGPFKYFSKLTSDNNDCIDGTLYEENNKIYLVYSHTLQDNPRGEMCVVELSNDLSKVVGDVKVLFYADEAPWPTPVPFAEKEFGIKGNAYFTDGPSLYETEDGKLNMLWSSWNKKGYSVGLATSENGKLDGNWKHSNTILIEDGGHGMLFTDLNGEKQYLLHSPNEFGKEHPKFIKLKELL